LLDVELLAAFELAQLADGLEDALGNGLALDKAWLKGTHEGLNMIIVLEMIKLMSSKG
jgi:hypothetical protein